VAQVLAAKTDGFSGSRTVHDQHRYAALDEIRYAARELDLFRDIEAVEKHHARRTRGACVLRVDEVAGEPSAVEGHLDSLDIEIGELGVALKTLHRGAIDRERLLVLRRAEALRHLVVVARAQVRVRGRMAVAGRLETFGVRAHAVSDFGACLEPCFVVLRRLAFQQPSDLVQLPDIGAAIGRRSEHVDERRRPPVVTGEIHEVGVFLGHLDAYRTNDEFEMMNAKRSAGER
jgi:hypothetical protein